MKPTKTILIVEDNPAHVLITKEAFQDLEPLKKILESLENQTPMFNLPKNGILTGRKLREWFHVAVQAKILKGEHYRIEKAFKVRRQLIHLKPEQENIALIDTFC